MLENLLAAKNEENCISIMVSRFLIVLGNTIANYRSLGPDAFIREMFVRF